MSAPFNLAETDRLLSTTRAVRRRLDMKRPVERNVILDCIRLSMQAPTGSNSQSWRWVVVTDAGKRAEIARLYREVGDQYLEMAPLIKAINVINYAPHIEQLNATSDAAKLARYRLILSGALDLYSLQR